MPGTGQVVIASIPADKAEEQGLGRPLNKNNDGFNNGSISNVLGGHHSEWKVETETPVHQDEEGSVWALTQTVVGVDVLAAKAAKEEEQQLKDEAKAEEQASVESMEEVEEEVPSSPVYNQFHQ